MVCTNETAQNDDMCANGAGKKERENGGGWQMEKQVGEVETEADEGFEERKTIQGGINVGVVYTTERRKWQKRKVIDGKNSTINWN